MDFHFIYYHLFITIGVYDHILVACFELKQDVSLCRLGLGPNCKTVPPPHTNVTCVFKIACGAAHLLRWF